MKMGVNLYDTGLGNGFLDLTSKAQATNKKQINFVKIKNFGASKYTTEKVKTVY